MNAVREEGCKSPGLRIFRLVDSQNHLKKSPRFIKGGERGVGLCSGGAAARSFRKERI